MSGRTLKARWTRWKRSGTSSTTPRESGDRARLFEEWGDLFFALVNVARYDGIDPEEALRQATKKFERRFRFIEAQAAKSQRDLAEMSLEEMDALWDEAKRLEDKESSPRS